MSLQSPRPEQANIDPSQLAGETVGQNANEHLEELLWGHGDHDRASVNEALGLLAGQDDGEITTSTGAGMTVKDLLDGAALSIGREVPDARVNRASSTAKMNTFFTEGVQNENLRRTEIPSKNEKGAWVFENRQQLLGYLKAREEKGIRTKAESAVHSVGDVLVEMQDIVKAINAVPAEQKRPLLQAYKNQNGIPRIIRDTVFDIIAVESLNGRVDDFIENDEDADVDAIPRDQLDALKKQDDTLEMEGDPAAELRAFAAKAQQQASQPVSAEAQQDVQAAPVVVPVGPKNAAVSESVQPLAVPGEESKYKMPENPNASPAKSVIDNQIDELATGGGVEHRASVVENSPVKLEPSNAEKAEELNPDEVLQNHFEAIWASSDAEIEDVPHEMVLQLHKELKTLEREMTRLKGNAEMDGVADALKASIKEQLGVGEALTDVRERAIKLIDGLADVETVLTSVANIIYSGGGINELQERGITANKLQNAIEFVGQSGLGDFFNGSALDGVRDVYLKIGVKAEEAQGNVTTIRRSVEDEANTDDFRTLMTQNGQTMSGARSALRAEYPEDSNVRHDIDLVEELSAELRRAESLVNGSDLPRQIQLLDSNMNGFIEQWRRGKIEAHDAQMIAKDLQEMQEDMLNLVRLTSRLQAEIEYLA